MIDTPRRRPWPLSVMVATGFGLGLSPVASGTVGCLLGIPLAAAVCSLPWYWQLPAAAALTLAAIPVCSAAESHFGVKDDGRIVADEYMTFPVCMIGLPVTPVMVVCAFVVNRVLDVMKPPRAWQAQQLHGGVGIVMDDAISSLYALAVNHALYWVLISRLGG